MVTLIHTLLPLIFSFLLAMNSSCAMNRPPEIRGNPGATECVVLLHGLARTKNSMNKMEEALVRAGYQTVNLDYPSREKAIEIIAEEEFATGVHLCEQAGAEKIHFVTHSLGGIIVRHAMNRQRPGNLGRVVMLSPPNQGSFVTDRLKNWWLYKWLNGPAGQELGTDKDSLPNRLGPVDYEVGIITGNRHFFFDSWFASFSPGEHDGKVSVEAARVEGMSDYLIVPETHPFIMDADLVIEETIHFLRHGTFSRP